MADSKLVSEVALSALASDIKAALELKANQATTYTKTETDNLLADKADKSTTYTKDQVDSEIKNSITEILDENYISETTEGNVIKIDDAILPIVKNVTTQANKIYKSSINLWNEHWELGGYDYSTGEPRTSSNEIRSKNDEPIPIQPNTDYYIKCPWNMGCVFYNALNEFISLVAGTNKKITSPENAYFLRFYVVPNYGTTYNNDIQVTFDSNAEKTIYHASRDNSIIDNFNKLELIVNDTNYIYSVAETKEISLTYYNERKTAKKPYQEGFIVFSVPSRITKSNNAVSASSVSEGSDDSVNVNCILKLPSSYTASGKPSKLIMICHGAGQSAQQWSTNASYNALVNTFVNAGYAVFDCNGFKEGALGYSFWGDSRGVDVWRKAYQYVVDNYNVEHQFGLYGFSMGGLTALNLALSNFPNIKCIALGSPVVNLEDVFNSSDGNKAVINALYNMGESYDASKAYGCNPFSRIITVNNNEYIFVGLPPLKMWYGSTEDGTSTDTGTGEIIYGAVSKYKGHQLVNAINNAGGQAEYREVDGEDHKICYGGNAVVNNDYLLFFNRHNKL